jgi:hypothetical protein
VHLAMGAGKDDGKPRSLERVTGGAMADASDSEPGGKGAARSPGGSGGSGRGRPGARKEDRIASQLRQVYDEALRDPIPEDMLKLLDQLDASAGKRK